MKTLPVPRFTAGEFRFPNAYAAYNLELPPVADFTRRIMREYQERAEQCLVDQVCIQLAGPWGKMTKPLVRPSATFVITGDTDDTAD